MYLLCKRFLLHYTSRQVRLSFPEPRRSRVGPSALIFIHHEQPAFPEGNQADDQNSTLVRIEGDELLTVTVAARYGCARGPGDGEDWRVSSVTSWCIVPDAAAGQAALTDHDGR